MEDILKIDIDELAENDYEIKFFTWSRKIIENVEYMESNDYTDQEIREYLNDCADLREKFLDKNDLTDTEEYYMEEARPIWREYNVIDPLYK